MDPTVFYYTFSTICQTLAGAYGIAIAISLFRIQALNTHIDSSIHMIGASKDFDVNHPAFQDSVNRTRVQNFENMAQSPFKDTIPNDVRITTTVLQGVVANEFNQILSINGKLRWSSRFSGCTVIASLALLAATPLYSPYCYIGIPALVIATACAAYSICTIYKLLKSVVD